MRLPSIICTCLLFITSTHTSWCEALPASTRNKFDDFFLSLIRKAQDILIKATPSIQGHAKDQGSGFFQISDLMEIRNTDVNLFYLECSISEADLAIISDDPDLADEPIELIQVEYSVFYTLNQQEYSVFLIVPLGNEDEVTIFFSKIQIESALPTFTAGFLDTFTDEEVLEWKTAMLGQFLYKFLGLVDYFKQLYYDLLKIHAPSDLMYFRPEYLGISYYSQFHEKAGEMEFNTEAGKWENLSALESLCLMMKPDLKYYVKQTHIDVYSPSQLMVKLFFEHSEVVSPVLENKRALLVTFEPIMSPPKFDFIHQVTGVKPKFFAEQNVITHAGVTSLVTLYDIQSKSIREMKPFLETKYTNVYIRGMLNPNAHISHQLFYSKAAEFEVRLDLDLVLESDLNTINSLLGLDKSNLQKSQMIKGLLENTDSLFGHIYVESVVTEIIYKSIYLDMTSLLSLLNTNKSFDIRFFFQFMVFKLASGEKVDDLGTYLLGQLQARNLDKICVNFSYEFVPKLLEKILRMSTKNYNLRSRSPRVHFDEEIHEVRFTPSDVDLSRAEYSVKENKILENQSDDVSEVLKKINVNSCLIVFERRALHLDKASKVRFGYSIQLACENLNTRKWIEEDRYVLNDGGQFASHSVLDCGVVMGNKGISKFLI